MEGLVNYPNTLLWAVGTNAHTMRTRTIRIGAEEIPLIPQLNNLAIGIELVQAVLPCATLCFK